MNPNHAVIYKTQDASFYSDTTVRLLYSHVTLSGVNERRDKATTRKLVPSP